MKRWQLALSALGLLLLVGAGALYATLRHLEVEQITDDAYMIRGLGGNVGVLRTDEGTVIVDTMTFPLQGRRIRERAEALTGQPVVLLINTHYHLDHTHGNPGFAPGVRVVATERTRTHLEELDGGFWSGDASAFLPNETFQGSREIPLGGKTIRVVHPGPGHTDGDLVALFVEDQTIHLGDLLFAGHYPNIDLKAGGTVRGWSATLDTVLALPFEHVIPGHGDLTDRDGVTRFQAFMGELAQVGAQAAATGASLKETLERTQLTTDAGFEELRVIVPIGLDRDFVISRAWAEATSDGAR